MCLRVLLIALGHSSNYFPPQLKDFDLEQYFVDVSIQPVFSSDRSRNCSIVRETRFLKFQQHVVGSGGFFLVVTTRGKIIYVSRQVEQHLGHVQVSVLIIMRLL